MKEEGKMRNKKLKGVALFEIFLLISMSFALAFIFSEEVGVGSATDYNIPAGGLTEPYGGAPAGGLFHGESLADPASAFNTPTGTLTPPSTNSLTDLSRLPEGFTPKATPVSTIGGGANPAATTGTGTTAGGGTAASGGGIFDAIGQIYGGTFMGSTIGPIVGAAAWGATVFGLVYLGASLFGLNKQQSMSVALSAGIGIGTWAGISFAAKAGWFGPATGTTATTMSSLAPFIGIGIGVGIFLATYKKEKKELLTFECLPWEPPLGGTDCEKCNADATKPCSEYRCKSLGQACAIVNKGTESELCVWVGKGDVQAPKITPWNEALRPKDLKYIPDSAVSPPNKGFKIVKPQGKGCLEAWTNFQFGIQTSEPAQCRIDYEPKATFDDMQYAFGESSLFEYNHTQQLKVPSPFTENGSAQSGVPEIQQDGTYTLYTRCIDANGNGKDSAFVAFKFCVNKGPDTLPPQVVGTSITDGSAVQFDVDKVPIEVYTNKPAECKWSHDDKAFEAMENVMNCGTESYQVNADLNFVCSSELNGIKNQQNNNFYFRCKSYPGKPEKDRYIMTQSYKLTLRGTEKLTIKEGSVGPSGIIKESTSVVNVSLTLETAHGADEGKSICYLDTKKDSDFTTAMDSDFTVMHNLTLYLPQGNYQYFFRCVDSGGNAAETNTSFIIQIDKEPPLIARVFKDGDKLKIITSEEAKCVYSLTNCNYNFEEATGTAFLYEDPTKRVVHYTTWNGQLTYYIKCADMRNRLPDPDKCSLVVKGSEL